MADVMELLKGDFEELLKGLCKPVKDDRDVKKYIEEYENEHVILQRPNKEVGEDENKKTVFTEKLPIPYQRKIVSSRASICFGNPVQYKFNDGNEKLYQEIDTVIRKNKLQYFDRKLARTLMSETHCAEVWYVVQGKKAKDKKIKVMLLAESKGDQMFPVFDEIGDMVAFIHERSRDKTEYADVYMADKIMKGEKVEGKWVVVNEPSISGKVNVIYYTQDVPEWHYVQKLCDRQDMALSKRADINDYYGDPLIKIFGSVDNAPSKEEVGKVLQFKGEPDVNNKL